MTRRLIVEPEAQVELEAAAEWYERQEPELGLDLLAQAETASESIAEGEHGTPVPGAETEARRVPISKFPLWIVFFEHEGAVVIVAYSHERRRPGYWRSRRSSS